MGTERTEVETVGETTSRASAESGVRRWFQPAGVLLGLAGLGLLWFVPPYWSIASLSLGLVLIATGGGECPGGVCAAPRRP